MTMITTRKKTTKTNENLVFNEVKIYDRDGKLKKILSPKRLLTRHWKDFKISPGHLGVQIKNSMRGRSPNPATDDYSLEPEVCSLDEINFTGN